MDKEVNIQLYTPHPKQLEIHKAINEEGVKYITVPIGRQFGKTALAMNQVIKWAVNNSWKIAWVSPTYKQCKKVFKDLDKAIGQAPFLRSKPNKSDLTFTLINGSEIIFYSAEAYDTVRGETFDALVCDEFAFFKPEAWTEALKPTIAVRGKKCLILSTPKGKGLFYNLHLQARDNKSYKSIRGTSYDNPYIPREEIEDAKRTLPDHIFKQEYLAEFLDDGGTVFRNIKECIKQAETTKHLFAGIDLGRADDYTVLNIVNDYNQEIYCKRWRHLEWNVIISNIANALNKYKPHTLIEANGLQDAIIEQIKNKIVFSKSRIQPFITTNKTKQTIIEDLIVGFENKEISIIGEQFQIDELETFTYDYNNKTRTIKYSAPSGLHDDYVMSRALSNYAKKTLKTVYKQNF